MLSKLERSEANPALLAAIGSYKTQETLDRSAARSPHAASALGTPHIREFSAVEG